LEDTTSDMFRHDQTRTFVHNLRLAALLSFVAGIVNVAGVLAIRTLTTNVTGHFAYFAEELVRDEYQMALTFLSYIFFFLSGAFICGVLVEIVVRKSPAKTHLMPLILEIALLGGVAFFFADSVTNHQWIARMLLFAMGLQNALVTKISKATVRTTHLTGLFTDLGIELSQLLFYKRKDERRQLSRSVYLRIVIISGFFLGGILGGLVFQHRGIYTFLIAAAILSVVLIVDTLRVSFYYRETSQKHL
jgi:uncharacterized membrane protein YoaK (UPF0700 family)